MEHGHNVSKLLKKLPFHLVFVCNCCVEMMMMMTMPYAERCWGTRGEAKSEQSREEENKIDFNFFPYDSLKSFAFTVGQFFFEEFVCRLPAPRPPYSPARPSIAIIFFFSRPALLCSFGRTNDGQNALRSWESGASTAKRRRRRSKMSRLSIFPMKFPQYQRWNRERGRNSSFFCVVFVNSSDLLSIWARARLASACSYAMPLLSAPVSRCYLNIFLWEGLREREK